MGSAGRRRWLGLVAGVALGCIAGRASPGHAAKPGGPVIVVGVDGMTYDVLDPLVAAGRMPNVAAMLERGVRAVLKSEEPMRSPALWTTIATGQPRDVHRIYDFVTGSWYWPPAERGGKQRLVTSDMRAAPALWQMAGGRGKRSLVVGWLNTWPAEPVDGAMFAPFVALNEQRQTTIKGRIYRQATGQTHPPELFEKVLPLIVPADEVPPERLRALADEPPDGAPLLTAVPRLGRYMYTIRWSVASTLTNVRILESMLQSDRYDLVMTYFDGADTLAHRFWLMRQSLPEIRARLAAHGIDPAHAQELKQRFGRTLDAYYELVDEMVGRIRAAAGPRSTVLLVSDHGWGPYPKARAPHEEVPFDGEHRIEGIFIGRGPDLRAGRVDPLTLYEIVPTVLHLMGLEVPRKLPGRVATEILRKRALARRAPVRSDDDLPVGPAAVGRVIEAPHEDTEIERLRSLGYVQ